MATETALCPDCSNPLDGGPHVAGCSLAPSPLTVDDLDVIDSALRLYDEAVGIAGVDLHASSLSLHQRITLATLHLSEARRATKS